MRFFTDPFSNSYARITGLFYFIIALAGGFAILYVPSQVLVAGDPAATAAAVNANRGLMMWGITGEALIIVAELFATTMLYFMFKPVNATLALIAAFARLSMAIVMAVMLFFTSAAFMLLDGGSAVAAIAVEQRQALALMFLETHEFGVVIWQLFFSVHLAMLGGLVAASGRFPRILGHAMEIGALGYLLDSAHSFMFPGNEVLGGITGLLLVIVTIGEVGFALWLLIRGQKQGVVANGAAAAAA